MIENSIDKNYFKNWNSIGPVYDKFGKTIILNNPYGYLKYFVRPNTKAYLLPPLEAYEEYNKGTDTLRRLMQEYFNYKSKVIPKSHPTIYPIVFAPIPYFFTAINVCLVVLILAYYTTGEHKYQSELFNKSLLCFIGLYISNCLFIIPLAPTVLRYHNFILTLGLLFTLLLFNSLEFNKKSAITNIV